MRWILGAAVVAGCAGAHAPDWKTVAFEGAEPVTLTVKTDKQKWWVGTGGERREVAVPGPCEVRVDVRLLLPGGEERKLPYTFEALLDGAAAGRKEGKATPDPDARFPDAVVGDRDSLFLRVPAGPHRVGVRLAGGEGRRFLFRIRRAEPPAER
ncbi:MAG: hypothetical protein L0216_13310 [Planctomycetales bacterium]|nr:hypothetical protein [Planctomycetales bacterium]